MAKNTMDHQKQPEDPNASLEDVRLLLGKIDANKKILHKRQPVYYTFGYESFFTLPDGNQYRISVADLRKRDEAVLRIEIEPGNDTSPVEINDVTTLLQGPTATALYRYDVHPDGSIIVEDGTPPLKKMFVDKLLQIINYIVENQKLKASSQIDSGREQARQKIRRTI